MPADMSTDLPSHASPLLAPQARPSAQFFSQWDDLQPSGPTTPGLPDDLVSPAFTPPATPGTATPSRHLNSSPKSTPVDTSAANGPSTKGPRLVQRLPKVECVVRARIPTTAGAEMFLHLYQNDSDDKEHLAIVFGNNIRSRTLDAEREGESEMDRMIRGAYVGRLRPGRMSSRVDALKGTSKTRARPGSSLKNEISVQSIPEDAVLETPPSTNGAVQSPPTDKDQDGSSPSVDEVTERLSELGIPQSAPRPPLVRIHSECYTGETAWSARCDCGEQLDEAARIMSMPSSTGGVVVYLRQEGRGIGLASKLMAYNLQDLGNDTVEANLLLRHPADARTYGLATAILVDLGLGTDTDETKVEQERGIRLLTNNPEKVVAVEGPEREVRVRERVAMVPLAWKTGGKTGIKSKEVEQYLATKIAKMAHMISEAS